MGTKKKIEEFLLKLVIQKDPFHTICFLGGGGKVNNDKHGVLNNGSLKDIACLIVETDEENPVAIASVDADSINVAQGYRVRLRPSYDE